MNDKKLTREPLVVKDSEIVLSYHEFRSSDLAKNPAAEIKRNGRNVPGVYFFYDENVIYIGESVRPFARIKQHRQPKDGSEARLNESKDVLVYSSPQLSKSFITTLKVN